MNKQLPWILDGADWRQQWFQWWDSNLDMHRRLRTSGGHKKLELKTNLIKNAYVKTSIGGFWSKPERSARKIILKDGDGLCRSFFRTMSMYTPVWIPSRIIATVHVYYVWMTCFRLKRWRERSRTGLYMYFFYLKKALASHRCSVCFQHGRKYIKHWLHVYAQHDGIILFSVHINSSLRFYAYLRFWLYSENVLM